MVDSDKDQKTEAPTGKRLAEAREKGQLPVSREVSAWALFIAILVIIAWLLPPMASALMAEMRVFIERPDQIRLDGGGLQTAMLSVLTHVGVATFVTFVLLGFAVVVGVMAQTGFYFNLNKLQPNLSKLAPIAGLKQLFSTASLVELVKSFVKLVVIGGVVTVIYMPLVDVMPFYVGRDLVEAMLFTRDQVIHLLIVLLVIVTVIAVGDLLFQRFRYFQNLRMTKTEVKDEYKQMEGDPIVKSRLRQIRLAKARKRMIAQVPKADVVITNPTHYAVALQYDNNKMSAPVVLAKGTDRIATRIREVAEENNVPLVSNPPLARALYDTVDIDEAISAAHYRAVAEVISYVYKLKKKKT